MPFVAPRDWESAAGQFRAISANLAAGDQMFLESRETDGAAQIGTILNTENAFATAGALLLSIQNNSVPKLSVSKDGDVTGRDFIGLSGGFSAGYIGFRFTNGGAAVNLVQQEQATPNPRVRINCTTAITTDHHRWLTVEDNGTPRFAIERVDAILGSIDTVLMLGGYYLWVDTNGDLRINNAPPAADGDGTIVGTQS